MVKDGSALERLARVDRALIDKTGSLTLGRPTPDPATVAALSVEEASIALALASHSRHPLARALAKALADYHVVPAALENVVETPGYGMTASWRGSAVALRKPEAARSSAVALDVGERPVRLITFADALRPDYSGAIGMLEALDVECSILSGDNARAVAEAARATGLTAQASASPLDKRDAIERLQHAGRTVLMVGDGLNDGPALAAADASIAPGTASDVSRQAADIVFLSDSLLALPRAVVMARRTMRIVRENFALSIGYNVLAVPLAVFGYLTPLLAAIAMSTSSLVVIGNSLRLARSAK